MGIGAPITVVKTAVRHMMDANLTFGQSSDRFNVRNQYRTTYTDGQRVAAGVGTAFGVALPVAAGVAWLQHGLHVPGLVMPNIGRGAGLAALGLAAGVGVKKTIEITKDDGHLGAVGTAAGVVGGSIAGLAVGHKFAGRYAPLVGGAGALIGGVAGRFGGAAVRIGESQIGEGIVQKPQVDQHIGDRISSFARGGFNHFNEVGPTTQGVSLGRAWGMRAAVEQQYSNAERSGAMHGDLLAFGVLGGGALAVVGGLAGAGAANGASNIVNGANVAGHVLGRGVVTSSLQKLGDKGALGIGAAAAGLTGVVAIKEWDRALDASDGSAAMAALYAGGVIAASAGTAALVSRSSAVSHLAAGPKVAASMLIGSGLIGVASAARLPIHQFYTDAKAAAAANGGIDWKKAVPSGLIGAVSGGYGAFTGLNRAIPESGLQLGKVRVPKALLTIGGTALSSAAAGGVGVGLSSTMPGLPQVGMSVAGGAVAGAAVAGLARGVNLKVGIIGGAALGLTASALLRDDAPVRTAAATQ
ncbi:MAG: hypothetical protein ABI200_01305 [Gaiellales bacterium]